MKLINLAMTIPLLMLAGCGDQGQPANNPEQPVFSSQKQALEKAKQVEGVLQDRALEQREIIDQQSK